MVEGIIVVSSSLMARQAAARAAGSKKIPYKGKLFGESGLESSAGRVEEAEKAPQES